MRRVSSPSGPRRPLCGLLCLLTSRVGEAALGAFTLLNELPRPVRVTVEYNFTTRVTENGHTWSDSDIRVEEALVSPGFSRDWSLGVFDNAFWEVLSLRIEPLPTLMVSLRPSSSSSPSSPSSPGPLPINTAVPFHAPLATFSAPFPFESGCDPATSTRLAVSYEVLAPGGPSSRASAASGYSRIILVRLPSPSDSDPHAIPPPPTSATTHATVHAGGESSGAPIGEGSSIGGEGAGVGVVSPEVALTPSSTAAQMGAPASANAAVTAQKKTAPREAEREKEATTGRGQEPQGGQDRQVMMRPSKEEEGGQRRRTLLRRA